MLLLQLPEMQVRFDRQLSPGKTNLGITGRAVQVMFVVLCGLAAQ